MRGICGKFAISPSRNNLGHGDAHGLSHGFSLFKGKPKSDHMKRDVVTVLECPECSLKTTRGFQKGDYIFKRDEPCSRCGGMMVVTAIHTRKEKQSGAMI